MHDVGGAAGEPAQAPGVEDVCVVEEEVGVVDEIGARQGVAMEVVHRHHLVTLHQPAGQGGADEARPAGDDDALALESHDGCERTLTGMRAALATAVAAGILASAAGAGPRPTALTVTFWPDGSDPGRRQVWTLRCEPPMGTLPAPARACRRLAQVGAGIFAPIPQDAVCTQIYGGPQVALSSGGSTGVGAACPA